SLKSLRAAGRSKAPQPFIGFGDPAFAGAPGDTRSMATIASLCREGAAVDSELVRGLPRLRDTAGEIRQIAKTLKASDSDVILGAQATEGKVRSTDLSRFRVVAFATHGILPGELKCKSEPALALTPPATSTADEDGLLDAAEIAQLKLDADWVVLSACNTAAPDGKLGGQSFSGLARAFFYAGARALLVTHCAEDAQLAHQRPKLEQYGDSIFVVLRPAILSSDEQQVELGETHIFVGPRYVVSIRHGATPSYAGVRTRCQSTPTLLAKGPGFVLY